MRPRKWTDEELDLLIKDVLLEQLNQEPPIDIETAYQDFKRREKAAQRKKRRLFRRQMLIPAAATLLLLVYIVSPISTNAFQQMSLFWQKMRGDTLNIMIGADTPPPFDKLESKDTRLNSSISLRELDLNEVKERYQFSTMFPQMEGLELINSEAMFLKESVIEVHLMYKDLSTETEIKLVQKDMKESGIGTIISQNDTVRKELTIQGEPAFYIEYDTGLKEIMWIKNGFLITIGGIVEEERLLNIAQSVR